MRNFLRETWELWYWAHFCPSKLQRRMNEWAPAEEKDGRRANTSYSEILLLRANRRFIDQFLLLVLLFSLPLILVVATNGEMLDWLFVILALFTAYGIGTLFLPLGLQIPLLFMLVYLSQPMFFRQEVNELFNIIHPFSQISEGLGVGALLWMMTLLFSYMLRYYRQEIFGHAILVTGSVLSVTVGSWLTNQSWLWTFVLCGGVGLLVFSIVRATHGNTRNYVEPSDGFLAGIWLGLMFWLAIGADTHPMSIILLIGLSLMGLLGQVSLGMAMMTSAGIISICGVISLVELTGYIVVISIINIFLIFFSKIIIFMTIFIIGVLVALGHITFGITTGIIFSVVVVGSVMINSILKGINILRPEWLWLASWLIGMSLSPIRVPRLSMVIVIPLLVFSVFGLGWLAFLVVPVILVGYFQLFPTYPVVGLISLRGSQLLHRISAKELLLWFHRLPPHLYEPLWLPLPGHDRILAAAFRTDTQVALETLQQMRTSPYPGLPRTARRALPQLVSDQLLAVTSLSDLIVTATPEHPFLPFLVPTLYQSEDRLSDEAATSALIDAETALIFPRLQTIARDISAALEGGSVFLRQRGLEESLNKLTRLQGQLPGMALNVSAIPRWRAVLEHWQAIIQAEIKLQRTASQGEVINPFQSGNPLRDNRTYLFKGRQQFADAIVRQILDRARPTLVLHGPRRCGKTSFLYNLPRLLSSDMIPVFVDLQKANMTSSESNFCYGLVRAMRGDMRSQGLAAPAAKRQDFRDDPYAALEDWLDEVEPLLESRRILLCLDEFEKLGSAIREGIISLKLLDELRHLIQHRDELSFLLCGVQTLAELGPNWSSYFISIQPIEMTYLEPHEARELLENPDPKFDLRYDEGIVEQVLQVTRCQPYLVQLIGEAMVNQANLRKTRLITPPLLEAALNDALTSGEPYFTNLWDEYTGTTPDEIKVGRALLHNLAHRKPLPTLKASIVRAVVQRLIRYHLIEKVDESYRFEVPFVERWVREWGVLE